MRKENQAKPLSYLFPVNSNMEIWVNELELVVSCVAVSLHIRQSLHACIRQPLFHGALHMPEAKLMFCFWPSGGHGGNLCRILISEHRCGNDAFELEILKEVCKCYRLRVSPVALF